MLVKNIRDFKNNFSDDYDESSDEISEESNNNKSEDRLEIQQLDCQRGDAALVLFQKKNNDNKYKNEKTLLIDTGLADFGEYLQKYLEKNKINHIDSIIFSHMDIDHIGGGMKLKEVNDKKQCIFFPKNKKIIDKKTTVFRADSKHNINEDDFVKQFGELDNSKEKGKGIILRVPEIGKSPFKDNAKNNDERKKYYKVNDYNNNKIHSDFDKIKNSKSPNLIFLSRDMQFLANKSNAKDKIFKEVESYKIPQYANNEASISSLIYFNKFYYSTSGDVTRRKQNFITDFLSNKLKIQVSGRKTDHHLSYLDSYYFLKEQDNLLKTSFVINSYENSEGKEDAKHPNEEGVKYLSKEHLSFIYSTNSSIKDGAFSKNAIPAGMNDKRYNGHIFITTTTLKSKNNAFDIRFLKKVEESWRLYKDKYLRFEDDKALLEHMKKYWNSKSNIIKNYDVNYNNTNAKCENHMINYANINVFSNGYNKIIYEYYINLENYDHITRNIQIMDKNSVKDDEINLYSDLKKKNDNYNISSIKVSFIDMKSIEGYAISNEFIEKLTNLINEFDFKNNARKK